MKLWVLLLLTIHVAYCQSQVADAKLKVALYYEALCPDCTRFITTQLYPTFYKIGSSYFELDFTPFGNANMKQENGTYTFECQHGPEECAINKLEACGMAKNSEQVEQLNYLNCVEGKVHSETDLEELSKCAVELNVPANDVLTCAQGAEGNSLLAKMGKKQGKLVPKVKHVPWLIFNDQKHDPSLEDKAVNNMFKATCELLNNKPAACL